MSDVGRRGRWRDVVLPFTYLDGGVLGLGGWTGGQRCEEVDVLTEYFDQLAEGEVFIRVRGLGLF